MTHTLPSRRRTPVRPASSRAAQPEALRHAVHSAEPGAEPDAEPGAVWAVPAHWAVFHPLPGAAPLVVGPGGIFTVSVHNIAGGWAWVDKRGLLVSGRRVGYVADAQQQADRVFTLLQARIAVPAPVLPVLALDGARFLGQRDRPLPVKVLAIQGLEAWLAGLPTVLRAFHRMELAAVIDSPATWGTRPRIGKGLPPRPPND